MLSLEEEVVFADGGTCVGKESVEQSRREDPGVKDGNEERQGWQ